MPYMVLNDIKMNYTVAWEGPTLTLLHGAALTIETNWANQIPVLSRKHRILAMDLRGHGRTNNPCGIISHDLMVNDVLSFLKKMDIERTNLLGFSMGGMIATRIALKRLELVNTLILCATGYYVTKEGHELFAKKVDPQLIEGSNPKWTGFYSRIHVGEGPDSWRKLLKQFKDSPTRYKVELHDLSRISAPTLIVVGDRDPYGFTKQALDMHEAIRGSEFAILPDAGHMIMEKKAELFNKIVLDFPDRRKIC